MSDEKEIKIEVLEELLDDIKLMHPEYIEEHIKEQIDILKNGI